MKALVIDRSGPSPAIKMADIAEPTRSAGQALIEVHASSVNRADLAAIASDHRRDGEPKGPTVAGLDASGVVIEADERSGLHKGQRVMVLARGALAERVVVDDRLPIVLPDSWSFAEGAGAALVLLTAHNAIRTEGRLRRGETVYVNGANSGAGQMAIKVAVEMGAGTVIAGVRTTRDEAFVTTLGANAIVSTSQDGLGDHLLEITGGRGVDVIVDHVGAPNLPDHIQASAVRARIICVGRLGGATGTIDLDALAYKRIKLIGVTFRTRTADELAILVEAARTDLMEAITSGLMKPRIDRVVAWSEVLDAHDAVSANTHLGKVVLTVRD